MSLGTGIDQKLVIGGSSKRLAHRGKSSGELFGGELELTKQNSAGVGNLKAGPRSSCGKRQSKIGNEQRFSDLGFSSNKEDPLVRQNSRFEQTGSGSGLLVEQLTKG